MIANKRTKSGLMQWEYPDKSEIKICEVENQAGTQRYGFSYEVRIPAKITGTKRQKKRLKTKDDAFEYAKNAYNGYKNNGISYFELNEQQKKIAAIAISRVEEMGLDLLEVVDFGIKRLNPAGGTKTFKDVMDALYEIKSGCELKSRTILDFRSRANRLSEYFGDKKIHQITKTDINYLFQNFKNAKDGKPLTLKSKKKL